MFVDIFRQVSIEGVRRFFPLCGVAFRGVGACIDLAGDALEMSGSLGSPEAWRVPADARGVNMRLRSILASLEPAALFHCLHILG